MLYLGVISKDSVWCHLHPTSEEGLENQDRLKALHSQEIWLPFVADANSVTRLGEGRPLGTLVGIFDMNRDAFCALFSSFLRIIGTPECELPAQWRRWGIGQCSTEGVCVRVCVCLFVCLCGTQVVFSQHVFWSFRYQFE